MHKRFKFLGVVVLMLFSLNGVFLSACGNKSASEPFAFELQFGEPVIVAQGEPVNFQWGYFNFPSIHYTKDGNIVVSWEEGTDNIRYDSVHSERISADGGKTWQNTEGYSTGSVGVPMANGKFFAGFPIFGSHEQTYLQKYSPAFEYSDRKIYFREDLLNDPDAQNDMLVWAQEYDAQTDSYNTFQVQINWPYAPINQIGDLVYPFQMMFALQNQAVISVGDDLFLPMYFNGLDSDADSRQKAIEGVSGKSSVYVFKSSDNGRTWNYLSQVLSIGEFSESEEGFTEPKMTVMPDGSFFMLMRTGSVSQPCYFVRSTDGGITWSEPVKFDSIGVLPQLLTLKCGVTLATYGRPELRIRATSDPSGLQWETPINKKLFESCYYTRMIALDDNTALLVYTDGSYNNPNGDRVKSVVVRTITVVPADQ